MRKRRLSRFQLDALVVIEINKIVNQFFGLLKSPDFLPVYTLSPEDRAVTEEALPAPHLVPDRQFACRNRNIRSWTLQRIDT